MTRVTRGVSTDLGHVGAPLEAEPLGRVLAGHGLGGAGRDHELRLAGPPRHRHAHHAVVQQQQPPGLGADHLGNVFIVNIINTIHNTTLSPPGRRG